MKRSLSALLDNIRLGGTPLVILVIFYLALSWSWNWGVSKSYHLVDNIALNLFLNLLSISVVACVFGYLRKRDGFQNFITIFLKFPIVGPMIYRLLAVGPLTVVEVRTVWGPTPEESAWEYAILLGSWEEDIDGRILKWYRVHTLGFGSGKLFSRVGSLNIILIPNNEQKDAWLVILTMGFFDLRHKNKST